MKAIVVYESLWGNTAAVARAIAEGLGSDAQAFPTSAVTAEVLTGIDLIVAGAPVLGFSLPSEGMRENIRKNPQHANNPPDFSSISMRSWLDKLPKGRGRSAAFETRIWWSPGGSTAMITRELEKAGYPPVVKRERFIVKGTYGPLKEGELERARAWGASLASLPG